MADIRLYKVLLQEEVVRKVSEDRHCFRGFKHDICCVASGPSVEFSKHLCLHSLCAVAYVICNLQTKN